MRNSPRGIVVAAVLLAGCSGANGEDAGSADESSPASSSAATTTPGTTAPASTTSTTSTTTTSGVSTTTTLSTSSTTAAPTPAQIACATLTTGTYLARRDVVNALTDRDGVAALCGDALTATEQAMAVAAVTATIDGSAVSSSISLSCQTSAYSALITNPFPVPIGFFGLGRARADGGVEVAAADAPIIRWSIAPGAQTLVTGALEGQGDECGIDGVVFLADDPSLPGDAGIPTPDASVTPDPPTPAEWFPLLIERELAWQRVVADPTGVPTFEDVRSTSFARLTDPAQDDGEQLIDTDATARVCAEVERPDDDHVALVFEQRWTRWVVRADGVDRDDGPGGGLWFGAFRRGQDGLWRWLGTAQRIPSDVLTTCEAWIAAQP